MGGRTHIKQDRRRQTQLMMRSPPARRAACLCVQQEELRHAARLGTESKSLMGSATLFSIAKRTPWQRIAHAWAQAPMAFVG